MPTYEYECKKCNHHFEVFQSMSDDPLKNCAKCGKEVRRLICGGAGVIFKGSGFYVTDKSGGNTAAASTETKENTVTTPDPAAKIA
ncbi:MAG: FmdB family transcriptional regulator [Treponema sp.]|nr:FmdB family transcriptional regulator [Treponema sp.]